MSNSSRPCGLQHTRPPCPSATPGVYPHSCPLSHPTISSSVIPFSSCLQSFSASRCFQMSQLFSSGGQCTGDSASTSVLPMNTQDWSPLGCTGWISLQARDSWVFSNTTIQQHQFFGAQPRLWSNSHIHTRLLVKNIDLTVWIFVSKVMSVLFNMLSMLVVAFLPRSKSILRLKV